MKTEIIDRIIQLEWKQFDAVQNEGGRASCQDDFKTFEIMRKSQFLVWPEKVLESYEKDVLEAGKKGWNLISEKYARMIEFTNPAQYENMKDKLPAISEDRIKMQDQVVEIQVVWMEEFASSFPRMAGNARSIRKETDTPYLTSYETYLRGEISTYSDETFALYQQFVLEAKANDENIVGEIQENTAHLYGYKSLEDAEASLKN